MKTTTSNGFKPNPRGQRPRCLNCTQELEPQFIQPVLPAKLNDGRKKSLREAWEQANPLQFTGHYGRLKDDRFCTTSCGYNWAVKHTQAQIRKKVK
jgi:hypothetical protein